MGWQHRAVDPGPVRPGKKGDGARDVLLGPEPLEGVHLRQVVDQLGRFAVKEERRRSRPGRHRIDGDVAAAQLLREHMRQYFYPGRSEERRVGKGCVSTRRSRWSPVL